LILKSESSLLEFANENQKSNTSASEGLFSLL
jgi:hypothetical protein